MSSQCCGPARLCALPPRCEAYAPDSSETVFAFAIPISGVPNGSAAIGFDPVYPRETGFQPTIANRTVDRSEFRRLVGIRSLGRRLLAEFFAPWRGDLVSPASAARRGFRAPARTFAASSVGRRPSSDQLHGECTRRASVRLWAASSLLHGTCTSAVKSVHRTP